MNNKQNFKTLLKKEIYLNYLISPLGFIFAGLFSGISLWLFFQDFFVINQARLTPLFSLIPFLFLFFMPAITMNLFSEEQKNGTWEILLTLPTNEKQIVLSKFLAGLIFSGLALILTMPVLIIVGYFGQPDWKIIVSSYLGSLFLAAAYLSSGLFISSLTNNSVISFLVSIFFLLLNFFLGQPMILSKLPTLLRNIISNFSLTYHFNMFVQGNILLPSLIFFLSWIFIFIWLTVVSLKSRDY